MTKKTNEQTTVFVPDLTFQVLTLLEEHKITVGTAKVVLNNAIDALDRSPMQAVQDVSMLVCKEQRLQQLDAAAKAAGLPGIPKEIEDFITGKDC